MKDNEYKEVKIGPSSYQIPNSWQVNKVENIINIKNGYAFKSKDYIEDGIPLVRVINVNENNDIVFEKEVKYLPKKYLEKYSKYVLKRNDILLVMVGASTGKIGKIDSKILPALLNQNMWNLKPKNKKVNKLFFYYLIKKEIGRFLKNKIGSARSYIKKKDFNSFLIPIPPKNEQKKIAKILSKIDTKIQKEKKYKEKLERLKKGLMQKLLTGKIRVN